MNNFENLNRHNPGTSDSQDAIKGISSTFANNGGYQNEGSNGSQKNIGPKIGNAAISSGAIAG